MPRIRSIHPSLFTDDAYMALSLAARCILPGLWTESDDQGVFAWKPLTLKARLMPADAVDMMGTLFELQRGNFIKKFTVEGKDYGAVRNFRKFQRPKKPTSTYPLPSDLRTYVGLPGGGGEPVPHQEEDDREPPGIDCEPEDHKLLMASENRPQVEDGGDQMDDEGCRREGEVARAQVATAVSKWRSWKPGDPVSDLWKVMGREARRTASLGPCNIELEAARFTSYYAARVGTHDLGDWNQAWINWVLRADVVASERVPASAPSAISPAERNIEWEKYPEAEQALRVELTDAMFDTWLAPCRPQIADEVAAFVAKRDVIVHYVETRLKPRLEKFFTGKIVLVGLARERPADDGLELPASLVRASEKVAAA